jgi:2-polyprenyl-3-methyl-5-hydroxy-6-metoxy-1,4-benzoquinol methylase
MEDYQIRFVSNVRTVVENNWLPRRPKISILDMGCDPTGVQLREIAALTKGIVTGINVYRGFPSRESLSSVPENVNLVAMDGMALKFPDSSFDLVISANVIEHVPHPDRFISEASRVLKPNGIAYIETAPVWTSCRGHHVMEGMVRENSPMEDNFRDDGTIIPDWSHLIYDRAQMRQQLAGKLLPETVDYILWYIYDSGDLNKWPWKRIKESFHKAFPFVQMATHGINDVKLNLAPTDSNDDYGVYGFRATCRKKKYSPIKKRVCWRLRRLGF